MGTDTSPALACSRASRARSARAQLSPRRRATFGGRGESAPARGDGGSDREYPRMPSLDDGSMAPFLPGARSGVGPGGAGTARIRAQMEYCANNPDELSKVSRVQAQVSEVKNIMMDNIEKVLDRGEKIELLVDKTENLRFQADNFHRTGRQLRQRMWWNKLKMQLMFASAFVMFILVLFLIFCYSGGNDCTKKKE